MHDRIYLKELGGAMLLYAVLLLGSNAIDDAFHPNGTARMALALSPMIGAVLAAWAVMRKIRRLDEMQRRIQLDAISLSFLATALITFSWGFAEAAGAPHFPTFGIWPLMAAWWVIGVFVAKRRYL
jgi:amino acid transporter